MNKNEPLAVPALFAALGAIVVIFTGYNALVAVAYLATLVGVIIYFGVRETP